MAIRPEWRLLALWATAVFASVFVTRGQNATVITPVLAICMIGSMVAIRRAAAVRVEAAILVLWLIALAAMLATAEGLAANVLAPVFFVCMLGSFITARNAYAQPD